MKKLIVFLLITLLLFTTGCWDMVEINERIYPYSFGIDVNGDEDANISLTVTYPNIKAIGKNPSESDITYAVNTKGTSIFQSAKRLTTEVQGPFYYKHLRVVLLGEEAAKQDYLVKEMIDGLMRDYIINKKVHIAIVNGKAEDLLKTIPEFKRQVSVQGTLYGLLNNTQRSTYFTPKHLSDFIFDMDNKGASIVPLIVRGDDELKVSGGGIFKDYRLIGYIDEKDNMALSILNDKTKTDVIDTNFEGSRVSLSAINFTSEKRLIKNSENLKIKYNIEIEGAIQEFEVGKGKALKTEEGIKGIEKAIEEELIMDIEEIIYKLQKEYRADALRVGEFLSKFHPKIWNEVKEDWDNTFADMDIEIELQVKIRRRGLAN